jgi:phosphatidylserine decarboxylase
MKIHKEGIKPVIFLSIVVIAIALLLFFLIPRSCYKPVFITMAIIYAAKLFFILRFFRVPYRVINKVDNGVISPADGTVIAIEEELESEYFNEKRLKISIFMSIYNVHVNFHPMSGTIEYVKYHPGKHLVANLPKASKNNEHNTVVIRQDEEKVVLYRQIAGFIARRIVCHLKQGMPAVQGEEMGMIRFGSRVDVFLPVNVEIAVNIGDKVTAQKSVLAYF